MIGETVSHYRIIESLGQGGMGVVYKAHDTKLNRIVALKFLPSEYSSDIAAKERFVHEAQAASALDHPNICTIHEIGETEGGQSYIAMACYQGHSLKLSIDNGQLTIDNSIEITVQIAKGLQKAHNNGIIHRDIKPANIMITEDGTIKILDFGLAKLAGQTRLTKTGSTVGTIAYMSPEQARGDEIDQRTDIWSLGVVLYEMLTGQLPFKGDYEQAMVYSILNEEPLPVSVLNEDVSVELETIVHKCLTKDVNERYQTIEEILADFKGFSKDLDISFDESLSNLLGRMWRKKNVRSITITASSMAILISAWLLFWPTVTSPIPIAIIHFENQSDDQRNNIYCKIIPDLLNTALEQSGQFQVNDFERLRDLLKQIGKDSIEIIDSDTGFELCRLDGISNIGLGSFTIIEDMIVIDIKILDVKTKDIIQTAQSKGIGIRSIFTQIDNLAKQVLTRLGGWDEEIVEQSYQPIVDVTTNNLDAYKYYLLGREKFEAYYLKEAKDDFEKAILFDSTFAGAHGYLGIIYSDLGSREKGETHLELAKKYQYKVTRKEKILFNYWYDMAKGNDLSKSFNELKKATSIYPTEKDFFYTLAYHYQYKGETDTAIDFYQKVLDLDPINKPALNEIAGRYLYKGDNAKALEYLQRYIAVAPNDANSFDTMGAVYLCMNDYQKSLEMYERAIKIKPDFAPSHEGIASNFIRMRQYHNARNQLNQWSKIDSSYSQRRSMHYFLAKIYLAESDIENTLKELENTVNLSIQKSDTLGLAFSQFNIAMVLYENDRLKDAEGKLAIGKKLMGCSDLSVIDKTELMRRYLLHAIRLALKKGNIEQAKEYAENYKKEVVTCIPDLIKEYYVLSGLIAYTEGKYDQAISDMKQAHPGPRFAIYYLALAYIKNGEEIRGIDELESLVNYSDIVSFPNEMLRALAEKQLARLRAGLEILD